MIPGLGRSLEDAMATHSVLFLPGESPWAEEPGRYSSWAHKELNTTEQLSTAQRLGMYKGGRVERLMMQDWERKFQ